MKGLFLSDLSQGQFGGGAQSEPMTAMPDIKLWVEVKGEEDKVEEIEPSCQVLSNFNPRALSQGQATLPKINLPRES